MTEAKMRPVVKASDAPPKIHSSAEVEDGAAIGAGTSIWHFCHVFSGAKIGADCVLGQNVMVAATAVIGDRVKIQNNVSVYDGVTLEDGVFCGPSCVFTNVTNPRAEVNRKDEFKPTRVGRGATIGANATIVCGVSIGEYAFIGAGAVVTRDVAPHALVTGSPARQTGWTCACGEKLNFGGAAAKCKECGRTYGMAPNDNIEEISEETYKERSKAMANPRIPMVDLNAQYATIGDEIESAVLEILRTQRCVLGEPVERLEGMIAEYCGTKKAVGVSSGSDALIIALMALGIGPGDEVITSTYTFFATGGAIARVGAKPVFVDILPDSYNIDTSKIEAEINERTKAIIPVHLYGACADMDPILEIAGRNGIPVVEDAAQAIGADYKGRRAGSMGLIGCFSFYPSKNLSAAGDAGMVVTNDEEMGEKLRILRTHGGARKYFHDIVGGNFRIDAIQAAVLGVKFPHLESWTKARQETATRYERLLGEAGLSGTDDSPVKTPAPAPYRHIYHQYVIEARERDALQSHLNEQGVSCAVYYPLPLHQQPCFAPTEGDPPSLPVSERAAATTLALPIYPELGEANQRRIVDTISEFYA